MNDEQLARLQAMAQNSPYADPEALKRLEQAATGTLPMSMVASEPKQQPVAGTNRKQRRAMQGKGRGAKRPSSNNRVHVYAERVRRMTDDQIWAEGHKAPTPDVIENVIRDIHEDLLSVLAPHFGDDIMAKIAEVLANWYKVKGSDQYTFSGPVKDDGIDRPLTEDDRTVAGGILGPDGRGA